MQCVSSSSMNLRSPPLRLALKKCLKSERAGSALHLAGARIYIIQLRVHAALRACGAVLVAQMGSISAPRSDRSRTYACHCTRNRSRIRRRRRRSTLHSRGSQGRHTVKRS